LLLELGDDEEAGCRRSDGTVWLRNCPYHAIASDHRELTCGMNLAWAKGVVDGLGSLVSVELAPEPGRCCLVFRTAPVGI
jgi:predicted ArsR family transcriptional regulator